MCGDLLQLQLTLLHSVSAPGPTTSPEVLEQTVWHFWICDGGHGRACAGEEDEGRAEEGWGSEQPLKHIHLSLSSTLAWWALKPCATPRVAIVCELPMPVPGNAGGVSRSAARVRKAVCRRCPLWLPLVASPHSALTGGSFVSR